MGTVGRGHIVACVTAAFGVRVAGLLFHWGNLSLGTCPLAIRLDPLIYRSLRARECKGEKCV